MCGVAWLSLLNVFLCATKTLDRVSGVLFSGHPAFVEKLLAMIDPCMNNMY